MKIDPIVKDILQELKFNPSECLWEKHGATCMKHRYIEIAGQEKGVVIESLDEVEKNSAEGVVAIKCTASLGKSKVITYGEATPKNNKNGYPYAMAEKRAIDRAILKLIGIHGFVYSDDEVDDKFENVEVKKTETKEKPKKKIDDLYITTALEKIENNKDKKDSVVLRSEMENLKTEIHQSMGWDAFTKTEKFKKFNALKNQILKQRRS
tara:strand:- start:2795 stop:3421 length:627 start_codon:yes stop_codon:yes gene_type:complete